MRTGDEITHRRLWARVASPMVTVARPVRWSLRFGVLSAIGAGVVGGVLVWPHARSVQLLDLAEPRATVATAPATPVVTPLAPARAPHRTELRRPLLDGPVTVRTKAGERARLRLWGGTEADVEPSSIFSVDAKQQPAVERGRVSFSVPHQEPGHHLSIAAGSYTISVIGTRFHVRVAGDSVGVDVEEGIVEVRRGSRVVRVEAGESWTSPSTPQSPPQSSAQSASRSPAVAPVSVASAVRRDVDSHTRKPIAKRLIATSDLDPIDIPGHAALEAARPVVTRPAVTLEPLRDAHAAVMSGHPQRALEILELAASGDGPVAENASYEIGRVLRDSLNRPRQAVVAWNHYRMRFPHGVLRAEADLSIVDTLARLGDSATALSEAKAFLAEHPDSERSAEISRLVHRLQSPAGQAGPGVRAPGSR